MASSHPGAPAVCARAYSAMTRWPSYQSITGRVARAAFIVHHARSGTTALNVVTAALGTDPRTRDARVVFARDPEQMARALREAAARGERPVAGWSFYSPDFAAAAEDLREV